MRNLFNFVQLFIIQHAKIKLTKPKNSFNEIHIDLDNESQFQSVCTDKQDSNECLYLYAYYK